MKGIDAMSDPSGPNPAGAQRTAGISKCSRPIRRILVLSLAAAASLPAAAQQANAAQGLGRAAWYTPAPLRRLNTRTGLAQAHG